MKIKVVLLSMLILLPLMASGADNSGLKIPDIVFKGKTIILSEMGNFEKIIFDGQEITTDKIIIHKTGYLELTVIKNNKSYSYKIYSIPGFLTLLPPIFAIVLALIFKEVIISLLIGILIGSILLNRFDIISGFFNVIDKFILEALADKDRAAIIIFTLLLGGMVGIINKSGGVKGIVESLSRKINSAKSAQFYSWLMGLFIFFDDYTNTLIVGNTMRPLTDKWKISREKLAYIVDSTAAPVASIAIISTWIGFEISLINQSLKAYQIDLDAYHLFISSLPFRFYSLFALLFVFLIFTMKKDFGPMLKAERRARKGRLMSDNAVPLADFESSALAPPKQAPARWFNALIPILAVIVFTFIGLYISGKNNLLSLSNPLAEKSFWTILFSQSVLSDLRTIISEADSFRVLLGASFVGVSLAMFLAYSQKILKLREIIAALIQGMKSMIAAIIILLLAWSLNLILVNLNTADFLTSLLSTNLDYHLFPAIVFVFSALISFSTGSSWGTIAIMFPLFVPMTINILKDSPDFLHILILTISSVLAGSVFGDHCSPISDTTIMSSTASSCDHIDHVKTQIPYALVVAFAALCIGIIPVSFGFPYFISFFGGIIFIVLALSFMGKKTD